MYSKGYEPPYPDTILGGTDDIEIRGIDIGSKEKGPIIIKFRRNLDTGDDYDYVIK